MEQPFIYLKNDVPRILFQHDSNLEHRNHNKNCNEHFSIGHIYLEGCASSPHSVPITNSMKKNDGTDSTVTNVFTIKRGNDHF